MANLSTFQKAITTDNTDVGIDWRASEIKKLRERYMRWFTEEPEKN